MRLLSSVDLGLSFHTTAQRNSAKMLRLLLQTLPLQGERSVLIGPALLPANTSVTYQGECHKYAVATL